MAAQMGARLGSGKGLFRPLPGGGDGIVKAQGGLHLLE